MVGLFAFQDLSDLDRSLRALGLMQTPALCRCQPARGSGRAGLRVADLRLREVARQQAGHVVDHAAFLALMDSFRRGADEHHAEFVLAVIVVIADLDFGGRLGIRAERLQRFFDQFAEAAADIAGPADLQGLALRVEAEAGFVLVDAARVSEAVLVDVTKPWTQRGFHLGQAGLGPQRDGAVYVCFNAHSELQLFDYTPGPPELASKSAAHPRV